MIAKDDVVGVFIPQLGAEPSGDWIPFHVFPAPLEAFDLEIVRSIYRSPETPAWMTIGIGVAKGVHISGFGRKSREFILLYNGRCVKCRESGTTEAPPLSISSSPPSAESMPSSISSSLLSAESMPTTYSLETTTLESEEEVLTLVEEEFPLLLRDSRDTMEILRKVGSMSDFSTLSSDAFTTRLQSLN